MTEDKDLEAIVKDIEQLNSQALKNVSKGNSQIIDIADLSKEKKKLRKQAVNYLKAREDKRIVQAKIDLLNLLRGNNGAGIAMPWYEVDALIDYYANPEAPFVRWERDGVIEMTPREEFEKELNNG